jgi:hypothetical protein
MDKHIKFIPLSIFAVFALKALLVGATLVDAPLLAYLWSGFCIL